MNELSSLKQFVNQYSFPCLMAKSVMRKGLVKSSVYEEGDPQKSLSQLYLFVDQFRPNKEKLASFILFLPHLKNSSFETFEDKFWSLLKKLRKIDRTHFKHDPRVAEDPLHNRFSFSLKEEALFILALHPRSPRVARRFMCPAIVFNPHEQFEQLRQKKIFMRIRNIIRSREKLIQGESNPMLSDFGEKSEIFQYTGRSYKEDETICF